MEDTRPASGRDGPHVVLGAGGGTGAAIVSELLHRGLPVRTVTRRELAAEGVDNVVADLADAEATREAVDGGAVVYQTVNPAYGRWLEDFPGLQRSIMKATAAAGARLVFADNLYMYGPGAGVMTEQTPMRATDKKGRLRTQMASELLAAHAAGSLEVVIGRSPDYLGPGGRNSALGAPIFDAAIGGKTVRWVGSLDVAHSVAYLPDMARALVTLGLAREAVGHVWHLPTNGAPTGRVFLTAISDALGHPIKGSATPRWMLRLAGLVKPEAREMADIMYQWEEPFVSSDAAFQSAFGPMQVTPLAEAVADTVAWFEAQRSDAR